MSDSREKMIDKIKALLSKTTGNGCTQEEELTALDKARALMDAACRPTCGLQRGCWIT